MADDEEGRELFYAAERCDLLLKVKSTVDGLLANGSHVTWSTYGGLARISDNVEKVLIHGSRVDIVEREDNQLGIADLFNFLKDFGGNTGQEEADYDQSINQWIQKSLLNRILSVILDKFVKRRDRLKDFYYKFAFMRSQPHFQAFQHCLRAIEEDNPLLPTTIDQVLLNKPRYVEDFRKRFLEKSNVDGSSSEYASANEDVVGLADISSDLADITERQISEEDLGTTNDSNENDFFSMNDNDGDDFFVPKSSLPSSMRTKKNKPRSKFNETLLATAALTAATQPVDVQNEIRWFEGELPKADNINNELNLSVTGSSNRRPSNESLSSNSTLDSLPLDGKIGINKEKKAELSEHEKKKKIGHYRSKSDQFHQFRPFGTTKPIVRGSGDSFKGDQGDSLSSSLPTNSDVAEFYGGSVESSAPSRQPAILGFLSSREYDSCHEFDRENAHFSISEALINAVEQMKCEAGRDSGQEDEDDDDDDGSDEEILELRAQIEKKKRAKRNQTLKEQAILSDINTRSSSATSKSSTSLSSGSRHSSFKELPKSVDSDYNSCGELPSPECSRTQKVMDKNEIRSGSSLDTSSLEISCSPISAEQVALCLLEKVASKKNLTSADLKWMVSEQDVPQNLLPLPTAVPVSPDDELYDTGENFDRRASLPCRLRGNLEWAPPRQQIIFSIPPNPKRKDAMAKQGYRCAGCGMRVDPGYAKRFRYCNYLGKYSCNTCHSAKPTVIPARIIQRWDFKEYEVSKFARDLLARVHNDPLFNVQAINKSLYKRVKEMDEVKFLRLQLRYLVSFLRTCRFGDGLLEHINTFQSYIIHDTHLYSIRDLLEVKSGVFRDRLDKIVKLALEHVSSCQLCLAKGFVCEYCKNGDDIIYPFEVKRCTQCPDCGACYHRECFVRGKCPKCERILLRKKAAEVFGPDEDL